MTIKKIIELVDRQKPNQYDEADKIHWLSQMDYMVYREVISTHEGGAESFDGYTAADAEKQVLGGDEFADMYVKWLYAMIDFANQEIDRYSNSMIMFNSLYADFCNAYNRAHMPRQVYVSGCGGRIVR